MFDLNDFDETVPGPWEWDGERLAASLVVAARDRGLPRKRSLDLAHTSVAAFRKAVLQYASMSERNVWYSKVDASELERAVRTPGTTRPVKRLRKMLAKTRRKGSSRAFEKLAAQVDGTPRILPDCPLIVPVEDLLPITKAEELRDRVGGLIELYRSTVQAHHHHLLDTYQFVHLARKVAGRHLRAVLRSGSRACTCAIRDRIAIASYLGRGEAFDKAVAAFADQNERDYQALVTAVKTGRLTAHLGV